MSSRSARHDNTDGETAVKLLPPGQRSTEKLPVMSIFPDPAVSRADWRLVVTGLSSGDYVLTWADYMRLPQIVVAGDFHCVTQWSKLGVTWDGVSVKAILDLCGIDHRNGYAMIHSYDGYTTNLDLPILADRQSLLAHSYCGSLLAPEHGGPVRLVVPKRYGWKSAKWVGCLEIMNADQPGFWEEKGYNMRGDPWLEERFS